MYSCFSTILHHSEAKIPHCGYPGIHSNLSNYHPGLSRTSWDSFSPLQLPSAKVTQHMHTLTCQACMLFPLQSLFWGNLATAVTMVVILYIQLIPYKSTSSYDEFLHTSLYQHHPVGQRNGGSGVGVCVCVCMCEVCDRSVYSRCVVKEKSVKYLPHSQVNSKIQPVECQLGLYFRSN